MTGRRGQGAILNRAEMADHLGISMTTLDDWVRRGCPVLERGSRGRRWSFNSADVRGWREETVRSEDVGRPAVPDPEMKRRRLLADTEMAEFNLARAKAKVVSIEQRDRAMAMAFAAVRENLRAVVPTRIARRVCDELDEVSIRAVVLEEVDRALEALSEAELLDADALAATEEKGGP